MKSVKKGFTLIEVIVSITIMASLTLGVFALIAQTNLSLLKDKEFTQVYFKAQEAVELEIVNARLLLDEGKKGTDIEKGDIDNNPDNEIVVQNLKIDLTLASGPSLGSWQEPLIDSYLLRQTIPLVSGLDDGNKDGAIDNAEDLISRREIITIIAPYRADMPVLPRITSVFTESENDNQNYDNKTKYYQSNYAVENYKIESSYIADESSFVDSESGTMVYNWYLSREGFYIAGYSDKYFVENGMDDVLTDISAPNMPVYPDDYTILGSKEDNLKIKPSYAGKHLICTITPYTDSGYKGVGTVSKPRYISAMPYFGDELVYHMDASISGVDNVIIDDDDEKTEADTASDVNSTYVLSKIKTIMEIHANSSSASNRLQPKSSANELPFLISETIGERNVYPDKNAEVGLRDVFLYFLRFHDSYSSYQSEDKIKLTSTPIIYVVVRGNSKTDKLSDVPILFWKSDDGSAVISISFRTVRIQNKTQKIIIENPVYDGTNLDGFEDYFAIVEIDTRKMTYKYNNEIRESNDLLDNFNDSSKITIGEHFTAQSTTNSISNAFDIAEIIILNDASVIDEEHPIAIEDENGNLVKVSVGAKIKKYLADKYFVDLNG